MGFKRVAPQVVSHSSGFRVQIGDRYHVEYVTHAGTARCEADLGAIPVVLYRKTLVWVDRNEDQSVPLDSDVVSSMVAGLEEMGERVELSEED